MITTYGKLVEAQGEMKCAELAMEMCLEWPHAYTLGEKAAIIERYEAAEQEVDEAIREDFRSLPPRMQAEMVDLLRGSLVPEHVDWWMRLLGVDQRG